MLKQFKKLDNKVTDILSELRNFKYEFTQLHGVTQIIILAPIWIPIVGIIIYGIKMGA